METLKLGDKVTIKGFNISVANPARKWWSFWRPKFITTNEPQVFRVGACVVGNRSL